MGIVASGNIELYNGSFASWALYNEPYSVNENETYRNNPIASGIDIQTRYDIEEEYNTTITGAGLQYSGGRCAGYIQDFGTTQIINFANGYNYGYYTYYDNNAGTSTNSSQYPVSRYSTSVKLYEETYSSTNIPVFSTLQEAQDYVTALTDEDAYTALRLALNYKKDADFDPQETETYHLYNDAYTCTISRGTYSRTSGSEFHLNTIFRANTKPALYFTGNGFEMALLAPDTMDYLQSNTPSYVLEQRDPSTYTVGSLPYTTPFYGNLNAAIDSGYTLPADGSYLYALGLDTNIDIFANRADAEEAITTGDYSKAGNYYQNQRGDTDISPTVGDEQLTTIFGAGMPTSPFASAYVMDKTQALNIAGIFYTDDASLLTNIKQGLELFGANPIESIISLSWFPFEVDDMVTCTSQPHIYFGSYQHTGITVKKVTALTSNYINAGTVIISPLFNSYRDLSPYTSLSVYLPYHGWETLEVEKYLGKSVNIRYYVDIYTNTGVIAMVANSQLVDAFPISSIGISLPILGANMSEYANSMLQGLIETGTGALGGALSGTMIGGGAPGAAIGAVLGGGSAAAKGIFEMSQKGQPKDHAMIKGSFSAGSASYMPQYVIFRYDINEMIVPDNLTELYGRPSSASGPVRNFSGFLKADTFKLNTSGMTESEISEVSALLKGGIYL